MEGKSNGTGDSTLKEDKSSSLAVMGTSTSENWTSENSAVSEDSIAKLVTAARKSQEDEAFCEKKVCKMINVNNDIDHNGTYWQRK